MLKKVWHRLLGVMMFLKVADGFLETIGGILLLVIPVSKLDQFVIAITQHELSQEPNDLIANALRHWAGTLTGGATMAGAIYLLAHGIVKVTLAQAVIRQRPWSYRPMMAFLGIFIAYDVYLLVSSQKWGIIALMLLDIAALYLTAHEHSVLKKAGRAA